MMHPAFGKGMRFAGASSPAGMINLLTAKKLTVNGTVTPTMDGRIGSTQLTANSAGSYLSIAAVNETPPALTFAAIVIPSASLSFPGYLFTNNGNTSNNNGSQFVIDTNNGFFIKAAGSSVSGSNFTPVIGRPYFCAASFNGVLGQQVVIDLTNGEFINATSTAITKTIGTPTVSQWNIGGDNPGNVSGCEIAAIMYSVDFTDLKRLVEWGAAPWDFWYPPTVRSLIFNSLNSGAGAAASAQARVMVLA